MPCTWKNTWAIVCFQTVNSVKLTETVYLLQAVQSFSRAVHLNPGDRELWEEDLLWSHSLLEKRKLLEQEKQELEKAKSGVAITEIHSDGDDADEVREKNERKIEVYKYTSGGTNSASQTVIEKVPTNYVQMRDYIPPWTCKLMVLKIFKLYQ